MQRQKCSGGGVVSKTTRLRGQSTVEYVLLIAIIALVVVFAGPPVAGAVRNQFSAVTNTVDGGTEGDNFISVEEKAYREAMKTVVNKDAKDWTLDEQKTAAVDIAKNGTASAVYAKAKAAMDAGTTWSVKLTDGKTMIYRIIGINHDDLADGSGKAGLTFLTINRPFQKYSDAEYDSSNGWKGSNFRASMNSGEIWNVLPSTLRNNFVSVSKNTNNTSGNKNSSTSSTSDRLFLLSYIEVQDEPNQYRLSNYPWYGKEGSLYPAFKNSNPMQFSGNFIIRSLQIDYACAGMAYNPSTHSLNNLFSQSNKGDICPAFCF